VGLRLERIPEKDEKIDLTVGYFCADLLIATQWSALKFGNFKTEFFF